MKTRYWISSLFFFTVGLIGVLTPIIAHSQVQTDGEMGITFKGLVDPAFGILDPENPNPNQVLEPEEAYGSTEGPLRIDFVPSINFSSNKIVTTDINYSADALLFKKILAPRGTFIQVSDYREEQTGWSLQVRQETQFTNQQKQSLNGAILSFDKSWINTPNGISQHPAVSKEVIRLNNIGETYTLAKADKGAGGGTWSVIFGRSKDNAENETPTLSPRVDQNGLPIKESSKGNQPAYMNDAINLSIPGGTKKEPGTYSTVLTWIISELP
ncbi:hypothetical protein IGJ02_000142 [Enterococcus sp. DIV0724b]|uniref:WxL domain-containing protein n=1 Tax=Enterococcus sp. DIV0724b TaxID=2774694 RepID=UPI003D2FEBE3